MAYKAKNGKWYSHKETPWEYETRKNKDLGGCGCLILIILFLMIF